VTDPHSPRRRAALRLAEDDGLMLSDGATETALIAAAMFR
jgi:hypothetical protein